MKYLNKFDTTSDYEASASTLEIPNVAYITATTDVIYNATSPVPVQYVTFADQLVGSKCATLYGDGTGCTEADLGAVTAMSASDWSGTSITSFDELGLFTGLTSLPQSLFEGCSSLTSVTIPESADTIGERAFSGCSSLSAITFETEYPPVDDPDAFDELPSDGNITVPVGSEENYHTFAQNLGGWTVNGETPVEYIEFADPLVEQKCVQLYSSDGIGCTEEDLAAVTVINASDWSETSITSFNELHYFTGVLMLPDYAFSGCTDLTSVSFPDGNFHAIGFHAFEGCTALTTVDFGPHVAVIYSNAFQGCTSLQEIYIPDSVVQINSSAFANCTSLSSITFIAETPPATIGSGAFSNIASTGNITVPEGYENNYFSLAQTIGSGWTVNNQMPS